MAPLMRFPANPITPHGAYHILHDRIPQMALRSYDDTVVFNMIGGLAIPDFVNEPSRVEVIDLKGLIPPWRTIDQKGATQDGVSFVDALYDGAEVTLTVRVKGKNPADCRRVTRILVDSIDAKRESTLSWFTHQMGYWWAPVRWFRTPDDPVGGMRNKTQELSLRLRADNAFWRSYPSVDSFEFTYDSVVDTFSVDYSGDHDLGPNWPQLYNGDGGGFCESDGDSARWLDDPDDIWGTLSREVVNGPYKDFETDTNNQVVEIELGSLQEWTFPDGAENHIWLRMGRNVDGTWNGDGIKVQIGIGLIILSRYNNFVETVMANRPIFIPALPGEKWRAVAGTNDGARVFRVIRNGVPILNHKETGTGSELGTDHRGVGFGMRAAAAFLTQATPARVRKFSSGDNAEVTQSTFLSRKNVGDQDMWDNYICFGPGTFRFWNGPNATANEYVEFGPLLPNQIMYLRTDPRKRAVRDMTIQPATPQQQVMFEAGLFDFLSFATGNNAGPLGQIIGSIFGLLGGSGAVIPPQGNPYSLLKGRWSKAIPPKSPGKPAEEHHVKVEIVGGNADSQVIVSGTPQRRLPY